MHSRRVRAVFDVLQSFGTVLRPFLPSIFEALGKLLVPSDFAGGLPFQRCEEERERESQGL